MQYFSAESRYLNNFNCYEHLTSVIKLGSLFLKNYFYTALSEMNKNIMCNNFLQCEIKKRFMQNVLRILQRIYSYRRIISSSELKR